MSISKRLIAILLLAAPFPASADYILQQVAPTPTDYVYGVDFFDMIGSGIGDVTATAQAVDWALGLGNASTSGCEAADFAGFTAGNIALIQRGACLFRDKVENAIVAGAVGVIIFNQGNTMDRLGAIMATVGDPPLSIPFVFASYDVGTSLDGRWVRIAVVPEPGTLALLGLGLAAVGLRRRIFAVRPR